MPEVGELITPLTRRVSQSDIHRYSRASGDLNPIHLDPDYAVRVGLPGTIAHGLLEMAILAEALTRWMGRTGRLSHLSCRFSKPLQAGDSITCSGRVVAVEGDVADLELEAISDRGARLLTHGRATVRFGS